MERAQQRIKKNEIVIVADIHTRRNQLLFNVIVVNDILYTVNA